MFSPLISELSDHFTLYKVTGNFVLKPCNWSRRKSFYSLETFPEVFSSISNFLPETTKKWLIELVIHCKDKSFKSSQARKTSVNF